jgi:O-antigen/teichoic acid export membrane protein
VLVLISNIPLLPPTRLKFKPMWQLGGLALLTRMMAWIWANIDTLFASATLGAVGAGLYSRAYNITTQMKEPFAAVEQAVRQAFIAHRSLDDATASKATLDGLRIIVIAASLIAASVIVLSECLVAVLLGTQWSSVTTPLIILSVAFPARVARLYLDGFTYARGSIGHMLTRDVLIVSLMTSLLWFWASEGIATIALIVAAIQFFTLLFRGGTIDIAIAGTVLQRLHAITPGYSIAIVLVLAGQLPSIFWPELNEIADWGIRLIICLTVCIITIVKIPTKWLPNTLQQIIRKKLSLNNTY